MGILKKNETIQAPLITYTCKSVIKYLSIQQPLIKLRKVFIMYLNKIIKIHNDSRIMQLIHDRLVKCPYQSYALTAKGLAEKF